jgi:IclR family transcriptional regulator, KDG regulon repressor
MHNENRGLAQIRERDMGTAKSSSATSKPKSKSAALAIAFPNATQPDYNIAVIDRTLDLLEALARIGPASLAALAESVGCTRTAGFRLLRTLQGRGFAIQDEARGLWRLGARWNVLGRAATEQGALAATAMPILAQLGKGTGENVYMRVREGMESQTVAIYQTDPAIRMYSEVGKRGPLHAGSSRILLAFAPEPVQTQLLAQRLNRFTPATRIDPTWIAADLQRIRNRGYLITADEVVAGAVGIAAPVRDAAGTVIAVVHISSPSMRMRPPRPRALLPQVIEAANRLSEALGAPLPSSHPGMLHSDTAPKSWQLAPGAMMNLARPHSIFR